MFGQKQTAEEIPPLLEQEGRQIGRLNEIAYHWLGNRYRWYNKVRTAKKGGFPFFGNSNLEEQMEATRSALQLLGRNLNNGLVVAFNSTVDNLGKVSEPPDGLPEKIDVEDRNNPPDVTDEQDALLLAFMPVRFMNLTKLVLDKGKGLDYYSEGLVKKLYFKVVAFYCDPANWQPERLACLVRDLAPDAPLGDYSERLAPLRQELDVFADSLQMFRFGQQPRGPTDPANANTLEDTFEITVLDLQRDLFFQSFILTGLGHFLFRYYLTLITAVRNPRALRMVSHAFQPALAKVESVRMRFQASFAMERAKIRLRNPYHEFYKQQEALPVTEMVKVKGREVRKINYNHKLLELAAYARHGGMGDRQAAHWREFLAREVVAKTENGHGGATLMEILNMMTQVTQFGMRGKLEVVEALRSFAEEQEKVGRRVLTEKSRKLDEAKRNKLRTARKFKSTEQFDMVKTIEQEAADLETRGKQELQALEQGLVHRKEALQQRASQMEEMAQAEGQEDRWKSAARIYQLAAGEDESGAVRQAFAQFVLMSIQDDSELAYLDFYKNVFTVVPGLSPSEKVLLRKALASRTSLEEGEMAVSEADERAYQERIVTLKTEINMEAPGTLERRFVHKAINTTVVKVLDAGLIQDSLALLLAMPFNFPNKPPAKISGAMVKKLLWLNQLMHPFPEHDIILPNVGAEEPPEKRINFNRLSKVLD